MRRKRESGRKGRMETVIRGKTVNGGEDKKGSSKRLKDADFRLERW